MGTTRGDTGTGTDLWSDILRSANRQKGHGKKNVLLLCEWVCLWPVDWSLLPLPERVDTSDVNRFELEGVGFEMV
jgi:hypothetical protein